METTKRLNPEMVESVSNSEAQILFRSGSLEQLGLIIKACFPTDHTKPSGSYYFYFAHPGLGNRWDASDFSQPGMKIINVPDFFIDEQTPLSGKRELSAAENLEAESLKKIHGVHYAAGYRYALFTSPNSESYHTLQQENEQQKKDIELLREPLLEMVKMMDDGDEHGQGSAWYHSAVAALTATNHYSTINKQQ